MLFLSRSRNQNHRNHPIFMRLATIYPTFSHQIISHLFEFQRAMCNTHNPKYSAPYNIKYTNIIVWKWGEYTILINNICIFNVIRGAIFWIMGITHGSLKFKKMWYNLMWESWIAIQLSHIKLYHIFLNFREPCVIPIIQNIAPLITLNIQILLIKIVYSPHFHTIIFVYLML